MSDYDGFGSINEDLSGGQYNPQRDTSILTNELPNDDILYLQQDLEAAMGFSVNPHALRSILDIMGEERALSALQLTELPQQSQSRALVVVENNDVVPYEEITTGPNAIRGCIRGCGYTAAFMGLAILLCCQSGLMFTPGVQSVTPTPTPMSGANCDVYPADVQDWISRGGRERVQHFVGFASTVDAMNAEVDSMIARGILASNFRSLSPNNQCKALANAGVLFAQVSGYDDYLGMTSSEIQVLVNNFEDEVVEHSDKRGQLGNPNNYFPGMPQ